MTLPEDSFDTKKLEKLSRADGGPKHGDTGIQTRWQTYTGTPWEAIGAAIDILLDLTSMIRSSAVSIRSSRLISHFVREDDVYFAEYAKTLVRKRHPYARRSLTDQLGNSIFDRRRYILYRIRHQEKINQPSAAPAAPPPKPSPSAVSTETRRRQANHEAKDLRRALFVPPEAAGPALSDTELRSTDMPPAAHQVPRRGALSGITEGSVSREEAPIEYPRPPPFSASDKVFACQYCRDLRPVADAQESRWRFVVVPFPTCILYL